MLQRLGRRRLLCSVLLASMVLCPSVWAQTTVYLDFNTANENGSGAEVAPFKTLEDAVSSTGDDAIFKIVPGATAETITIDEPHRLEKHGAFGNVLIGSAGHALTVEVNGGGMVTPGSGNYAPGSLDLTPSPQSNWSFLRWEGDLSGTDNPETVTLSAATLAVARFSPTLLPDLLVFGVSADASTGVREDLVTVIWSVENYGGATAAAPWKDGVYFSTDAVWDEQDKLLGDKTRASLLASTATYQDSLAVALPDAAPGTYWLLVRTDIETVVSEGVESAEDNTAMAGELLVLDPVLNNE